MPRLPITHELAIAIGHAGQELEAAARRAARPHPTDPDLETLLAEVQAAATTLTNLLLGAGATREQVTARLRESVRRAGVYNASDLPYGARIERVEASIVPAPPGRGPR